VSPTLPRRAAAEAIGTFALVFAGCGAIVIDVQRHGALGVVGIGLVLFLVLLAAIATLDHVSGAHFNPGVSLSFFLTRHLPARDVAAYRAAQFAGATLAALLLPVIRPSHPAHLGATVPSIAVDRAVVVEAVLTALLMLVIMSVATDTRAVGAPAAIAIAAAAVQMPARSTN
jgi:glycerol uptake facilitator-like aquaporin